MLFYASTPLFSLEAFILLSDAVRLKKKKKKNDCLPYRLPPAGFSSYPLTNTINNQKDHFFKAICNTSRYIFMTIKVIGYYMQWHDFMGYGNKTMADFLHS